MAALHRLVVLARLEQQQARLLARIATEEQWDVEAKREEWFGSPVGDEAKLRGLPCVGVRGGFGGAIKGTRPGDNLR
jgi:hypothetical protein